jgi:penicillin-binding protein 1A
MPLEEEPTEVTEVISVETARTMMQFLQAVVQHGTGFSASQLKHPLGGKTGTTNDFTDAWFIGFSPSVTCGTWIGYDDRQSLGEKETGARAALPMWMDFMRAAIADKPNEAFATGDAPKRVLEVSLSTPDAAAKKKAADMREDVDPDAPDAVPAVKSKPADAPAAAAPAIVPGKPAEEPRSGTSNPPPDTN